ncbi:Cytidylate kinase [Raineyella antarctica]|uniref:Cytidylate kinase n=2 Tax=Raineyella antarctica TaxID=1577474 RepID=A0A1G6GGQ8_9ACTN|nr:Cytidylate kinase [Raineyella antarctica]
MWEQYGAGLEEVAQLVAQQLGLPVTGQAFSSEDIEAQAAEDDANHGILDRLAAIVGAGHNVMSVPKSADVTEARDQATMIAQNRELVLGLAARGGVILGHDATKILAGRAHTLHVKLVGPVEDRIAWAATQHGIGLELARMRQEREDRIRPEMSQQFNRWDPRGTDYFDLIVNTTTFGVQGAAALIAQGARMVG